MECIQCLPDIFFIPPFFCNNVILLTDLMQLTSEFTRVLNAHANPPLSDIPNNPYRCKVLTGCGDVEILGNIRLPMIARRSVIRERAYSLHPVQMAHSSDPQWHSSWLWPTPVFCDI